jgi:hypothetical protein
MNFNVLFQLALIFIFYVLYSHAHSGSGSSALATSSLKFKKKSDKDKTVIARKKKIENGDDIPDDEDIGKLNVLCYPIPNYLL